MARAMFGFLRRSGVRNPSAAIRHALETAGLPPGVDRASILAVAESQGTYAGREVTNVRVFDSARAAQRGVDVRVYADLDGHPDLVLWTGRVERDGAISILRPAAPGAVGFSPRRAAERPAHEDDEHPVFRRPDR